MTSLRNLLPLLSLPLLLGGCTTPTSAPPATAPAASPGPASETPKPAAKNLRKGMREDEIRAAWGAPASRQDGKQPGEIILIYHFDVLTTQKMVAATAIEVPVVEPISGQIYNVVEPVLQPTQVTVTQTIVLQLLNGQLASWARRFGEETSFK